MPQVDVCFTWDHFLLEVSRRIGKASVPKFIQDVKDKGQAWTFFGSMKNAKPIMMVFQAARLETGEYAIYETAYKSISSRYEPSWTWVALVGKMVIPKSPRSPFRTGNEILDKHSGSVNMPGYARPDVPAGE